MASSSERPIRRACSLPDEFFSCPPSLRIDSRWLSTVARTLARSFSSRSASRCTGPERAAYQSMPSPVSRSCGSARRSAGPSPSRRRITARSWAATACRGSPRTPRGRTPRRVVRIRVGLSPMRCRCLLRHHIIRESGGFMSDWTQIRECFQPGLRKAGAPAACSRTMGVANTADRRLGIEGWPGRPQRDQATLRDDGDPIGIACRHVEIVQHGQHT